MISTTIPLKITSLANSRLCWQAKAKVAQNHRERAKNAMECLYYPPCPPLTIVLTRIGPRRLDSDNLAYAFKATRDGIADWLGIDDGSPLLDWQYAQRSAGPKVYACVVEVI